MNRKTHFSNDINDGVLGVQE